MISFNNTPVIDVLVLLATAAKYEYIKGRDDITILGLVDGHDRVNWNPIEDDADAFKLAVKTGNTDLSLLVGNLILAEQGNGLTGTALVRRAIVWAVLQRHKSLTPRGQSLEATSI